MSPSDKQHQLQICFRVPSNAVHNVLPDHVPRRRIICTVAVRGSRKSRFSSALVILPTRCAPVLAHRLVCANVAHTGSHLCLCTPVSVVAGDIRIQARHTDKLTRLLIWYC